MTYYKYVIKTALMAWMALSAVTVQASEWDDASNVIEQSTQAMVALLESGRLEAARSTEAEGETVKFDESQLFLGMEQVLADVIDFDSIAKGVMAKYYRQASEQQIEQFSIAFQQSLLNTYAGAVLAFRINDFEIQTNPSSKAKPGRQKVWVKIYANGAAYDVHYAMKKRNQGWKVTNVTLDGINLGLAFRQQFASEMAKNKGNIDDVIAFWNDPS
ncbi:MAG: ABC transporter substrate-binding protein [Oceanospirillaceae bacterium]|nr:ABC transporter substrate-binding protein [Oceanospirillaceae bacterium]